MSTNPKSEPLATTFIATVELVVPIDSMYDPEGRNMADVALSADYRVESMTVMAMQPVQAWMQDGPPLPPTIPSDYLGSYSEEENMDYTAEALPEAGAVEGREAARKRLARLIRDDLDHHAQHLITSTRASHAHLLAGLIVNAGFTQAPDLARTTPPTPPSEAGDVERLQAEVATLTDACERADRLAADRLAAVAAEREESPSDLVVDPYCAERNPGLDQWHGYCCRFPKSCSPYIQRDLLQRRLDAEARTPTATEGG